MSRITTKTGIHVDRFWPADMIKELAKQSDQESKKAGKKKLKSINIRFDILGALHLAGAIQEAVYEIDNPNYKITLTIYIDAETTHDALQLNVTAANQ